MTTIEDVMFAAYDYRNEEGPPHAAKLRAAIEQYAAERVAEVQAKLDALTPQVEHRWFDLD